MIEAPLQRNRVIVGDAARNLARLPAECVDMALTSPPYFALRDYQVPGQIGLETNVDEWVLALRAVARQLHRVLAPTGSLWLNVGDTYSAHSHEGAEPKSLLLGPERLALSLLADGWILRNKITWAKPNPMPSAIPDRLTTSWEALYVFVKQRTYYFDLDAIRVPHTSTPPKPPAHYVKRARRREPWRGSHGDGRHGLARLVAEGRAGHRLGKNPGDVWTIARSGYRGTHHATFPIELARRAITAGCPPHGTVIDPFFGAGTTAVAAEALGRNWLGIELNPEFARLAEQRIRDARPRARRP